MISAEVAERMKTNETSTRDKLNEFADKQPHLVSAIFRSVGNTEISMAIATDMAIFQWAIEEQMKEGSC
jgi:hypothetical protein